MASPKADRILQVGMGFFAAKTLLSAVELDLFTVLASGAKTGRELQLTLGLHDRANPDFFDALTALGMLERDGGGASARYRNTAETAAFLDRNQPGYIGGLLEMANARLYPFWAHLTEGLKSGAPQNEIKATDKSLFDAIYDDPDRLAQFVNAMASISGGNTIALAEKYDFAKYRTLADIGGASGVLAINIARRHPHMTCTSIDLPKITAIAQERIERAGLGERVKAVAADMFRDPLPNADVITMGLVLHDWNLAKKQQLIQAAYDALNPGGAFIVIESLIDDARRANVSGLLMSLNMLIETGDGFDYTAEDFFTWCEKAGFRRGEVIPLVGAASAAVVYK